MKRTLQICTSFAALGAFALYGCHGHDHDGHGDKAHGHGEKERGHDKKERGHGDEAHEGGHEGHGHAEGATAYTTYGKRTELFVEVPPLVVGERVELAAHLTHLENFKALRRGQVSVTLTGAGKPDETFETGTVEVMGIFRPRVAPEHAGKRTMHLRVVAGDIDESHAVGSMQVFANAAAEKAAAKPEEAETEGEIGFTKEQQWRIDFGMTLVARQRIRPAFEANGTILPRPDGQAKVTAPMAGRISAGDGLPRVGQSVERDQVVARLTPLLDNAADLAGLQQAVQEARLAKSQATQTVGRLEGLLAAGGIAERRLIDARFERDRAATRFRAARKRLAQAQNLHSADGKRRPGSVAVRTPLGGTVVAAQMIPGAFVAGGAELLHVVDMDRLWLEVHVTETHAKYLQEPQGAWFKVEGFDEIYEVDREHVIATGGVLDARTRTIPLYLSVDNPKRRLRVGMFADVHVLTEAPRTGLAIPASALVYNSGQPVVFVSLGGETFISRPVQLGQRDGTIIEILDGVAEGDWVVSTGAYAVRLATAKTQVPEHGHHH